MGLKQELQAIDPKLLKQTFMACMRDIEETPGSNFSIIDNLRDEYPALTEFTAMMERLGQMEPDDTGATSSNGETYTDFTYGAAYGFLALVSLAEVLELNQRFS